MKIGQELKLIVNNFREENSELTLFMNDEEVLKEIEKKKNQIIEKEEIIKDRENLLRLMIEKGLVNIP